jgi:CRP/FNR family transcriptional regulator
MMLLGADASRSGPMDTDPPISRAVPAPVVVVRPGAVAGRFRPECATCPARPFCLPSALRPEHMRLLDFVVVSRRLVHRGQALFRAEDPLDALYPIHAGFFKTAVVSRDGSEHVTALRMTGDVLGLDGIARGRHSCDAVALDQSEVCIVPYRNLIDQSLHSPPLQRALHDLMGRELARDQEHLVLLGGMWGVQRVAAFLLDISHRLQARGFSRTEFELRMTRREMGSYLGMELETVSRILSRLERERLIAVDRGHVNIRDPNGLAKIADA